MKSNLLLLNFQVSEPIKFEVIDPPKDDPYLQDLEKLGAFISKNSPYNCQTAPELYFPIRIFKGNWLIAGLRQQGSWLYKLAEPEALTEARISRSELIALLILALQEVNNA